MKRIFSTLLLLISISVLSFAQVSGTSLTPKSTKIVGPLAQYYKVVDRTYKSKGDKVYVEVRKIKEGLPKPWTKNTGLEIRQSVWEVDGIDLRLSIVFYDIDGDAVGTDRADWIYTEEAIQKMLYLSPGETASIPFKLEDASAKFFDLSGTFECPITEEEEEEVVNNETTLVGTIAGLDVHMTLIWDGLSFDGSYYYDKQKAKGNNATLKVSGYIEDGGHFVLQEYFNGQVSGTISGTIKNGEWVGDYIRAKDSKLFVAKLKEQ